MQVTRCNPRRVRPVYNDNMSRIFDDFLTPFFPRAATPASNNVTMAVDIYKKDGKIVIEAEIPGTTKENIDVDVKGQLLTLAAVRNVTNEVEEESSYRKERSYGKMERTFNLPYDINEEHVAAKYENGLLTLEISQPEEQKAKQIKIN